MKKIIKKNLHTFIFLFSFIVLNIYIGIKFSKKINYQDNFIRLHVIANSNSISDQIEKLKISEKINSYINSLNIPNNASKEQILSTLNSNSKEILKIANSNTNYTSALKIGKIKYEEKQSITYDMPSGTYDSVQLILGEGKGKNIWSFIFPNKESLKNIESFETILPGLCNIYDNTEIINSSTNENTNNNTMNIKNENITYSIKFVEIIKSII